MGKPTMWFSNRSDTIWKKMARGWKLWIQRYRNCTIHVAKTKTLISFAVTAKLICVFGLAYADYLFSHEAAHLMKYNIPVSDTD